MELTVEEIARMVSGRVEGDGGLRITGVSAFDRANAEQLTFANTREYLETLHRTQAGAVLVPEDAPKADKVLIRVTDPYLALGKVSTFFHGTPETTPGISSGAFIGTNFVFGKDVSIYPGVFIGDDVSLGNGVIVYPGVFLGNGVRIGDDTVIHPNVAVLDRCRIGNRVIVHAGSVIGGDGFGFAPDGDHYQKIAQIGSVRIDDDVEIGVCNAIDRATFGETWIQRGVKTDNLVHVAHNVVVGEDTLLVAQVGISGSVTIGHHCILAGQAGISQHLRIGNGVTVGPQAGVGKSIPDGQVVSGSPSIPHRRWLRVAKMMTQLPDMKKQLRDLQKRLDRLEED